MSEKLHQEEMLQVFREQARDILKDQDRFIKNRDDLLVGFESETAIYKDEKFLDGLEAARDSILSELSDIGDVELGVAQIELRTPPVNLLKLGGVSELFALHQNNDQRLTQAARARGYRILRVGANPFLPTVNSPRTNRPKYHQVPDFYNAHRPTYIDTFIGSGRGRVDVGDAAIVSLFQSFQVNLQARSFEDACDKMNRSFMIAPYLLALSGNSRYLRCIDTRLQDVRMTAWQKSHDTGLQDLRILAWEKAFDLRGCSGFSAGQVLRVGLPERYFIDLADYLDRAGRFPFILYAPEAALKIAIGMTWLDTRVKFIGDSLVVELRLLPTQPSIEEELALTLLYLGRLFWSQEKKETLLPFEMVRENRLSAMLHGMNRPMWFRINEDSIRRAPYRRGIIREIDRAKQGLMMFGLDKFLDNDLAQRMLIASLADRLGQKLKKFKKVIPCVDMSATLQECGMLR